MNHAIKFKLMMNVLNPETSEQRIEKAFVDQSTVPIMLLNFMSCILPCLSLSLKMDYVLHPYNMCSDIRLGTSLAAAWVDHCLSMEVILRVNVQVS